MKGDYNMKSIPKIGFFGWFFTIATFVCIALSIYFMTKGGMSDYLAVSIMYAGLFFAAVADKENRVSSTKSQSQLINILEQQRIEIDELKKMIFQIEEQTCHINKSKVPGIYINTGTIEDRYMEFKQNESDSK